MIKSMTGYGKAVSAFDEKKYTIEIKSLNSKQLDISIKLAGTFRDKEIELRNYLSQMLERGKIDLFIFTDLNGEAKKFSINKAVALRYQKELKELQFEMDEEDIPGLLPLILKLPDVIQSGQDEFTEEEWDSIRSGIWNAVRSLDESRKQEGMILEKDIHYRVKLILELLQVIEPFEQNRTIFIREKLRKELKNLMETEKQSDIIDENRFEQELIFYLERIDITEEKIRLKKHCDYFLETMHDENSQGKKLGFITQEIGREINTLGSKANDASIQKIVVQMKDELEKIKEQLLNIL
jgi:uncharacterized protein (TIGR00255 family)